MCRNGSLLTSLPWIWQNWVYAYCIKAEVITSPSLTVNENAIEQVTSAKSLGVYVDQNINWECHIENISKKIAWPLVQLNEIGI